MGCFPCGKLAPAVSHLNECYPPSKQLVAAGPDYKPLSQDLSKLVYFAVHKPSQLAKIGEELEGRVGKEARGSSGGYAKSRASLLISLAILKSLITECKRDLKLFSRSALRCIVLSLDVKVYQKGGPDLEVIGRAASCFTAFATYTDGGPIGVDDTLTRDYVSALTKFGRMAVDDHTDVESGTEKVDTETQRRMRLIGLVSLSGASGSDALFLSDTTFARQIDIIVPALLANLFDAPIDEVKLETAKVQMAASPSPYSSDFSARRPVNERRAPSLRAHMPGEKGPSGSAILAVALRSLKALVGQCQLNQASILLSSVFAYLDKRGWTDVERCCWLTEQLAHFTSVQYRFGVPTRLVELLADLPDSTPSVKRSTLLGMITTILTSSVSLVGLGVSELLSSLLTLIIRRIRLNERDALLPTLVQYVASLGAHIYYADQTNDIVEEISQRIAEIPAADKSRPEILRVLLHCILGVLRVVHAADDRDAQRNPPAQVVSADKGKGPQVGTPEQAPQPLAASRRNPVAPQVWQETLPLLCESTYAVRAVYARALLLFLQRELPRENSTNRPGHLAATRFSNALHAAIYTLAMSACLGAAAPADDSPAASHPASPVRTTHSPLLPPTGRDSPPKGDSFNLTGPTPSDTPPTGAANGTHTPPKAQSQPQKRRTSRRVSLPLNRLNSSTSTPLVSFDNVATPLDFGYIVKILNALHEAIPGVALMTGGPMLLALDAEAATELVRRQGDGRGGAWVLERKRGVRETVGIMWRNVGRWLNISMVEELADKTLAGLPEPNVIPHLPAVDESDILPPPDEPYSFQQHMIEGESSSASRPFVDAEILVSALAGNEGVQKATGRDGAGIMRRFGGGWTVESALRDSVERFTSDNVTSPVEAHSDIASAVMTNPNASYRSIPRGSHSIARPVDITDLREALGQGQASGGASFISTIGTGGRSLINGNGNAEHGGGGAGAGSGLRSKEDVREVLKDIFRDKKRGGGAGKTVVAA